MTRKSLSVLVTSIVALVLLTGVFFVLPQTNCCGESDSQLEQLTDRASAGQLDAIATLYERARKDGVVPMEEHWALEGALRGDKALRVAYGEIFRSRIDADRQKRLLSLIKERSAMPGASCLLESLSEPSSDSSTCK